MLLPIVLFALLAVVSCQKDDNQLGQMRMFTPAGDIKATSGETTVALTWNPSLYKRSTDTTIKYAVQLSDDSTFAAVIGSYETDTTGITFTDDLLTVRKKYFIRVKALGADSTLNSHWANSSAFSIRGEQYFVSLTSDNIIDRAVMLKWNAVPGLTKIVITPKGGAPIDIALNDADNTAKQKLIDALTPNTQYDAELFQNTKSKGYQTFTTKATLSGIVVDLRSSTDPTILATTLAQTTLEAGSTILLKRGMTYEIASAVAISKAVTITSGADLLAPSPAIIKITGGSGFNLVAGSNINYIDFKDVVLTSTDYSGKYIFNLSGLVGPTTIGRISFDNCKTEIFRGVFRVQNSCTNLTISNFNFNNCIIDSVKDFGVVNIASVAATPNKIENISITNSTIYKTDKIIISTTAATSVVIENSTINEAPLGNSGYYVDYNGVTVANGIRISNCIFGIGRSNAGNVKVRAVRPGSSAVNASGNYRTSDCDLDPLYTVTATNYGKPNTDLFQSPSTGDFKIKDNAFEGKATAGDPRWR